MFLSLISGSSGNATLLKHKNTLLLIDCGMSGKKLSEALAELDLTCNDITACLITHEHTDHTKGVGIISRRFNIPLFATSGTFASSELGNISDDAINIITPQNDFEIGDIGISPFSISHDSANPIGFSFFTDCKKLSLATDSGIVTDEMWQSISGSDEIILESNHDTDMLTYGPYPLSLKRRISGDSGHLSNDDAAKICVKLLESGTKKIMLAHLSHENNTPEIAYHTTKNSLENYGAVLGKDITLSVADRYKITRF